MHHHLFWDFSEKNARSFFDSRIRIWIFPKEVSSAYILGRFGWYQDGTRSITSSHHFIQYRTFYRLTIAFHLFALNCADVLLSLDRWLEILNWG